MKPEDDDAWKATTFEGNREDRLDRILKSSYEERFRWLEETYELLKDVLPPRERKPEW